MTKKTKETKGTIRMTRAVLTVALLLFVVGLGSGCTVVKPWDRDMLSRPDMAFDTDRLESMRRDHVYFSKEATPPGGGGGGGGCGCN
jgi:hypothetical protein